MQDHPSTDAAFDARLARIEKPLTMRRVVGADWAVFSDSEQLSGPGNSRAIEVVRIGFEVRRQELRRNAAVMAAEAPA